MPPKIIPNKFEKLTYYILDHYNKQLHCESCNTIWSSDGTAFMRDQGGSKDGMYYRQFRCKGKGKGKCSMSYTHEDFLALATRQLGTTQLQAIKVSSGFIHTPQPLSPDKRSHDGSRTGFTPKAKRVFTRSTRIQPPIISPTVLSISPLSQSIVTFFSILQLILGK